VNKDRGLSILQKLTKAPVSPQIVKKLKDMSLVKTEAIVENNRIKKKVYPVDWKYLLPEDVK
jgi:hypothetical protein